jgi:hypothetical protein
MQVLSGPNIYEVKDISQYDSVFINDHLPDAKAINHLNELISKSPQTKIFIEACRNPQCVTNSIGIPSFLLWQQQQIKKWVPLTQPVQKLSAFSFMINKTRIGRKRLIDLLDIHQVKTKSYTLVYNESEIYNQKVYEHEKSILLDSAILNKSKANTELFKDYLKDNVFLESYVHLVTEPGSDLPITFATEKTLFAFETFNIPIWIGGWGLPNYFSKMGFDIFDDIVDHSYQWREDPQERIDWAFLLNKHLLVDKGKLAEIYPTIYERLEHNQNLVRSNVFVTHYRLLLEGLGYDLEFLDNFFMP